MARKKLHGDGDSGADLGAPPDGIEDRTADGIAVGVVVDEPTEPVAPARTTRRRGVFFVLAQDEEGEYVELLSKHKTRRRAEQWIRDNKPMIRRYCAGVNVFRAREV